MARQVSNEEKELKEHNDFKSEMKRLLWDLREGPAVVGVKRDLLIKLLEDTISQMDDQFLVEQAAKALGWNKFGKGSAGNWLKTRTEAALKQSVAGKEALRFVQKQMHDIYKDTGDIRASPGSRADGYINAALEDK